MLLPVSIAGDDALPNRNRHSLIPEGEEVSSDSCSESSPEPPSFPELEFEVMSSIEALGGSGNSEA